MDGFTQVGQGRRVSDRKLRGDRWQYEDGETLIEIRKKVVVTLRTRTAGIVAVVALTFLATACTIGDTGTSEPPTTTQAAPASIAVPAAAGAPINPTTPIVVTATGDRWIC